MSAEIVPFRSRDGIRQILIMVSFCRPPGGRSTSSASCRRLSPREQRAYLDALTRMVDDGQPAEASCTQMLVELGDAPGVARRKAREALRAAQRRGHSAGQQMISGPADPLG
jgi:hypothetical protein